MESPGRDDVAINLSTSGLGVSQRKNRTPHENIVENPISSQRSHRQPLHIEVKSSVRRHVPHVFNFATPMVKAHTPQFGFGFGGKRRPLTWCQK